MRVLYSLICEDARIRNNGRMDIEGIFQQLQAPGFPAVQDRLMFVAVLEWEQEHGEIPFRIELRTSDGKALLGIHGETTVESLPHHQTPPQTRLVLPIDQVVFPRQGKYQFILVLDDRELPLCPIYLIQKAGT